MNLVNDATFYITSSSSSLASSKAEDSVPNNNNNNNNNENENNSENVNEIIKKVRLRRPSHISEFVSKMMMMMMDRQRQQHLERQEQKQRQLELEDYDLAKSIQRQLGRIGLRQRSTSSSTGSTSCRGSCNKRHHVQVQHQCQTPLVLPRRPSGRREGRQILHDEEHEAKETKNGNENNDHYQEEDCTTGSTISNQILQSIVFLVEIPHQSYTYTSLVSRLLNLKQSNHRLAHEDEDEDDVGCSKVQPLSSSSSSSSSSSASPNISSSALPIHPSLNIVPAVATAAEITHDLSRDQSVSSCRSSNSSNNCSDDGTTSTFYRGTTTTTNNNTTATTTTTTTTTTLRLVRTSTGWAMSSSPSRPEDLVNFDDKKDEKGLVVGQGEEEGGHYEDNNKSQEDGRQEEQNLELEQHLVDCNDDVQQDEDHRRHDHYVPTFEFAMFSKEVRDATPPSFEIPTSLLSFMDRRLYEQEEDNMEVDKSTVMDVVSDEGDTDAAAATSFHHQQQISLVYQQEAIKIEDEYEEAVYNKDNNSQMKSTRMATPSVNRHGSIMTTTAATKVTPSPCCNIFTSLRDVRFNIPPLRRPLNNVPEVSSLSLMDVDETKIGDGPTVCNQQDEGIKGGGQMLSSSDRDDTMMEECGSSTTDKEEDFDYDDDMDLLIGPVHNLDPTDSFVRPFLVDSESVGESFPVHC